MGGGRARLYALHSHNATYSGRNSHLTDPQQAVHRLGTSRYTHTEGKKLGKEKRCLHIKTEKRKERQLRWRYDVPSAELRYIITTQTLTVLSSTLQRSQMTDSNIPSHTHSHSLPGRTLVWYVTLRLNTQTNHLSRLSICYC